MTGLVCRNLEYNPPVHRRPDVCAEPPELALQRFEQRPERHRAARVDGRSNQPRPKQRTR
jgi:hypothetical protein